MTTHAGDGRASLLTRVRLFLRAALQASLALALASLSAQALPRQAGKDGPVGKGEEDFKAVDPYTKGDREILRKAGYVSLEPLSFAPGINSTEIIEALGGVEIVWAETEHFKICSSLKTYKNKSDSRENDRLEAELAQLAKKIPGFKAPRGLKLDPWLRLHLYALRLETFHDDFVKRFGLTDPALSGTAAAPRFLGRPMKPTILLAEKSSALGRFTGRFLKKEETRSHRAMLPGGAMFFGVSAEGMRDNGSELDAALYCAVLASVAQNHLDGLRDSMWATPLWLDLAVGHWYSRRVDARFTYYADGTTRSFEESDEHNWQPRVRGLVDNGFEFPWTEMLGVCEWSQLNAQVHLLAWSRVDWMLAQKDVDWPAFFEPLTVSLTPEDVAQHAAVQTARGKAAFQAGFRRTPEQCEENWRAWVLKTYARK